MPHDARGRLLEIGDEVLIRGLITNVSENAKDCNCTVELIRTEAAKDEGYVPSFTGNTKFVEKLSPIIDKTPQLGCLVKIIQAGVNGIVISKWQTLGSSIKYEVRYYDANKQPVAAWYTDCEIELQ